MYPEEDDCDELLLSSSEDETEFGESPSFEIVLFTGLFIFYSFHTNYLLDYFKCVFKSAFLYLFKFLGTSSFLGQIERAYVS